MTEHPEMPEHAEPAALYAEPGASWYWLLAGPGAGLAMLLIQLNSGLGVRWPVPVAFCVLVTVFLGMQVKAARIHTSMELTPDTLRQGAQTIRVDEIERVYPAPPATARPYSRGLLKPNNALANRALRRAGLDDVDLIEPDPEPDDPAAAEADKWQAARALGELSGVPRGRTGIGLHLAGGRIAQAWARHPDQLRAVLTPLVERRRGA